ncbi:MAG: HDIG domain-containing protein [Planctomycetes bacterium]|nr:HDIG domain-containing protein [Planctomycetota bacterium]
MGLRTPKSRPRPAHRERSSSFPLPRTEDLSRTGPDFLPWLLLILSNISAVAIVQWRGTPHAILVDQRAERPFIARVPFSYRDFRKTEDLRQEARSRAPHAYRERLDAFHDLLRQMKDLFDRSSDDVGLRRWPQLARTEQGKSKDEELHDCLRNMGPENYEQGIDLLFQTIRQRGVVSRERYEEQRRSRDILVVRADGLTEEAVASDHLLAPGYGSELRSCIEEALPGLSDPCRNLLRDVLLAELVATLDYDPDRTRAEREKAARSIQTVIREYREKDEILAAGEIATSEHVALLQAEAVEYDKTQPTQARLMRLSGICILVFLLCAVAVKYLEHFHTPVFRSRADSTRLAILCLVALATVKAILLVGFALPLSPYIVPAYLIPLPLFAAVIAIAYSQRMARVFSFLLALLIAVMAGNNFTLMVVLVLASFVAIGLCTQIRDRSKPLYIGLAAGGTQALAALGLALLNADRPWESWPEALSGLLNGLLIGVALTVLLPMVERAFHVVTDLTLLELSDQNHPLLRRLALEAPGTYQHTLMMAMLAEAGAEAIGANSLLARVGCYYHDIGKTLKPQYFVENEDYGGSRHQKLNPSMSTLIITSHTRDGVALAHEHRLPKAIIDFIPEHHGTGLIEYFYRQALKNADGKNLVDEALYRYPGPKPQSRETAIALLADTCEAACRTLSNPTSSRLRNLVHELILNKLLDGQLNECSITLHDLARIEDSFVRNLSSFYHARVKYPGNPS